MATAYKPLTMDTWRDFEALFGPHGADGGCWCMYWRITRKAFHANCGEGNKKSMEDLVRSGVVLGILVYRQEIPVGWVSVAPREDFAALERSPKLKRMDGEPVWSIVCFYAPKSGRGKMMRILTKQAVRYAKEHGAKIVEAYPYIMDGKVSGGDMYMGAVGALQKEGFIVEDRRGLHQYMRLYL